MKLKKFLFSGLMLTSLFSEIAGSSLVYNNNKFNIYKTTIHKENEGEAINSANMIDYGQKITNAGGGCSKKTKINFKIYRKFL